MSVERLKKIVEDFVAHSAGMKSVMEEGSDIRRKHQEASITRGNWRPVPDDVMVELLDEETVESIEKHGQLVSQAKEVLGDFSEEKALDVLNEVLMPSWDWEFLMKAVYKTQPVTSLESGSTLNEIRALESIRERALLEIKASIARIEIDAVNQEHIDIENAMIGAKSALTDCLSHRSAWADVLTKGQAAYAVEAEREFPKSDKEGQDFINFKKGDIEATISEHAEIQSRAQEILDGGGVDQDFHKVLDVLGDYARHMNGWRSVMELAYKAELVSHEPDRDDRSYIRHEIIALHRASEGALRAQHDLSDALYAVGMERKSLRAVGNGEIRKVARTEDGKWGVWFDPDLPAARREELTEAIQSNSADICQRLSSQIASMRQARSKDAECDVYDFNSDGPGL